MTMSSPITRRSIGSTLLSAMFRSMTFGCSTWRRLNASICLREVGGAHRGARDLFGVGAALVLRIERVQHDLGVADDRRQQVVEIVRDAAGQAADRFHLLRVAQLFFEHQPLGHRIVSLGHDRGEQQAAQRAEREKR